MKRKAAVGLASLAALWSLFFLIGATAAHQHGGTSDGQPMKSSARGNAAPIRTTMEEIHRNGGTPRGWRFRIPKGDHEEGREVFVKFECFACHTVKGEKFPRHEKNSEKAGPDLTGMGARHPEEYLFESVLHPNRVIPEGASYTGPSGLSKMPSYNHLLMLEETIDLVAYLKSLKSGGHGNMKMNGKPSEAGMPHDSKMKMNYMNKKKENSGRDS